MELRETLQKPRTFVLWRLPYSVLVGPILSNWILLNRFILGLFVAVLVGYQLGKLDPAGKTVVAFLYDFAKYLVRPKVHDDWGPRPNPKGLPEPVSWQAKVVLVEDGRLGWPLAAQNVMACCNRVALHRWAIQENILTEKHRGYQHTLVLHKLDGDAKRAQADASRASAERRGFTHRGSDEESLGTGF